MNAFQIFFIRFIKKRIDRIIDLQKIVICSRTCNVATVGNGKHFLGFKMKEKHIVKCVYTPSLVLYASVRFKETLTKNIYLAQGCRGFRCPWCVKFSLVTLATYVALTFISATCILQQSSSPGQRLTFNIEMLVGSHSLAIQ